MLALPASARLCGWLNAWLRGEASPDAVIAAVTAGQEQVVFAGWDEVAWSPALALGQLRAAGLTRASAALPVTGDGLGLAGPAEFNLEAYDAGEAVVLHDTGRGLVPQHAGAATRWQVHRADPPAYLPDVASADRDLRDALRRSADDLASLDVAAWNPEVADALMNLRTPAGFDGPTRFASAAAASTAVQGARCLEIVALAGRDDGGAVSAWEATRRRDTLAPLAKAARAALVAGCSSLDGH